MVLTASEPFTCKLAMSNITEFRFEWKWIKNRTSNFLLAKYQPLKVHEDVLAFWREDPTYNGHPDDSDILRIDCERGLHPPQKPVALMENLIRTNPHLYQPRRDRARQ